MYKLIRKNKKYSISSKFNKKNLKEIHFFFFFVNIIKLKIK
jgi:hypothetical protein